MKKILITGGLGYVGTELAKFLASKNYRVKIIDIGYFGNSIKTKKNIIVSQKNVGNISKKDAEGYDTVIHLAAISNDPSALLNSKITWETNVLSTLHLLEICKKVKIKKFIFASSGSVYGLSNKPKVDENTELVPISDYNKTKMVGEKLVNNYSKYFKTIILRPGTICGFSDSLRLDLTVNAMTFTALKKKKIFVDGGSQIRPQVHIKDMLNVYDFFIKKNFTGIYNVGFENISIIEVARLIKKVVKNVEINIKKKLDPRSYRLFAGKLLKTGFKNKYRVFDAIEELQKKFIERKLKYNEKSSRTLFLKKRLSK